MDRRARRLRLFGRAAAVALPLAYAAAAWVGQATHEIGEAVTASIGEQLREAYVERPLRAAARLAGRPIESDLVTVSLEVAVRDAELALAMPDDVRFAEDRHLVRVVGRDRDRSLTRARALMPADSVGALTLLVEFDDEVRAFGPVDGAAGRVRLDWADGRPCGP